MAVGPKRKTESRHNELIRGNPYWRVFEASRWMVYFIRQQELLSGSPAALSYRQPPY